MPGYNNAPVRPSRKRQQPEVYSDVGQRQAGFRRGSAVEIAALDAGRDAQAIRLPLHLDVGQRVEVFWPAEKVWYAAVVTEYSAETKMHSILYDDNDTGLMDKSRRSP